MSFVATPIEGAAETALPPLPSDVLGRLSLEQYHEMVRKGILTENDPVELWEGVLVQKMPKSPAQCLATELMVQALTSRVSSDWHVDGQQSLTLSGSEVEPDAMVVRGARRDYVDRHPYGSELALVVEVSDSTLAYDRGFKKELYARAGIPVYWIVNLGGRCIEVYINNGIGDYGNPAVFREADDAPFDLGAQGASRIPLRELLP